MIKIDISVDAAVTGIVRESVENLSQGLAEGLASPAEVPGADPDLQHFWVEDILRAQKEDCDFLLRLLRDERFGKEPLALDESAAEGVLRACSAARLRLRHSALKEVPDSRLESGEVEIESLPPPGRAAFLSYLFLAGLQTFIIHALDPASEEPPPEDDSGREE